MELLNATGMQAGYTLGMDQTGRQSLVVAVKGTFVFPPMAEEEPTLAAKQEPLIFADIFSGEPGLSSPLMESDFAPQKPMCDVVLNGTCHAPGGKPAERVPVSLRVGSMVKSFIVVGDRVWIRESSGARAGRPAPFVAMPISYATAFGGTDTTNPDPQKHNTFMANPTGIGYYEKPDSVLIEGKPVPNTEEINRPITEPTTSDRPMSFGPIGRNWQPRIALSGTYDQAWLDNTFPFLPADFDKGYYQSAPPDQQIPYPMGGEEVELVNLTPQGRSIFRLPRIEVPVEFVRRDYEKVQTLAVIDTIVIEPDQNRFMMTWRISIPLKKDIFEVVQAVAGKMPKAWYRARELGKAYYPTLNSLARSKRSELEEV